MPESFNGRDKFDEELEKARVDDEDEETAELMLLSARRGGLTNIVVNIDDLDCLRWQKDPKNRVARQDFLQRLSLLPPPTAPARILPFGIRAAVTEEDATVVAVVDIVILLLAFVTDDVVEMYRGCRSTNDDARDRGKVHPIEKDDDGEDTKLNEEAR